MKTEPILKRFNWTDNRIYKIRAFLWRFARQNKLIGQEYLKISLRLNLMAGNAESGYSITNLGMALVERHEKAFKQLETNFLEYQARMGQAHKGRVVTEAQKQAMREGRMRKKDKSNE